MDLVERIRVEILQDGDYHLHDIQSGASEVALFLPDHIEDKLALLLLVDNNTEVEGVGYRYKPTVFYVDKSL